MKKIVIYILLVILYGCAGEDFKLIIEDVPENEDIQKTQVIFKIAATINPGNKNDAKDLTRGLYTPDTILLPEGRYVHIYIYKGGVTPLTGTWSNFGIYTSEKEGTLTALQDQYDFTLTPGTYNIYAISELNNASDKTPPFFNNNGVGGKMYGLYNGLDYLWWSAKNVNVTDQGPTELNMVFNHVSSMIQLNMKPLPGHVINSISQCTLEGPSTSGCILQLATGIITPSQFMGSTYNMNQVGNSFYLNMLPYDTFGFLVAQVNARLDNASYSSWHSFFVSAPNSGFEAGNCYIYDVYLGSTMSSTNVVLSAIRKYN